ncbi:MAG: hypothetical protein AAF219_04570 [Myxococcota bacterium]
MHPSIALMAGVAAFVVCIHSPAAAKPKSPSKAKHSSAWAKREQPSHKETRRDGDYGSFECERYREFDIIQWYSDSGYPGGSYAFPRKSDGNNLECVKPPALKGAQPLPFSPQAPRLDRHRSAQVDASPSTKIQTDGTAFESGLPIAAVLGHYLFYFNPCCGYQFVVDTKKKQVVWHDPMYEVRAKITSSGLELRYHRAYDCYNEPEFCTRSALHPNPEILDRCTPADVAIESYLEYPVLVRLREDDKPEVALRRGKVECRFSP